MSAVVGSLYAETFTTGSAGESWTVVIPRINGVSTVWTPTVTDLGSGRYEWAFTPTVAGNHSAVLVGSTSGDVPINVSVLTAAQYDPASALSGNTVLTVSPIAQSGTLTLKRGDDYYAADGIGRTIQWIDQYSRWPDLTDALITFGAKPNPRTGEFITVEGSVIVPTGEGKTIQVEFVTTDTEGATIGTWDFDIQAVTSPVGHNVTLVTGEMIIEEDFVP